MVSPKCGNLRLPHPSKSLTSRLTKLEHYGTPLNCPAESRTVLGKAKDLPMPSEPTRTARIEARIAPDALVVVKRAAELQGRSVSDFVVAAAQEAAQRTIEETQIIRLSVEDQRAFAEAILNPPLLTPAMERAVKRHHRVIAASR